MDFTILWPVDPQATSAWDVDFNPIETRTMGTRAHVDAALQDAVPSIDFTYGEHNEAYIDPGAYLMLHGDPVTAISVNSADADVYDQLAALATARGWALFEDGHGTRL